MPLMPSPVPVGRLRPAPFVLCPACPEAGPGPGLKSLTAAAATAVWPGADLAIGYPFVLPEPRTALQMWTYNGSTGTDHRDVGIYDAAGGKIVTIGDTAAGTNSVLQLYDIADTALAPFTTYYCWMSCHGTTAAFFRWVGSVNVGQVACLGVVQMASAFVLPATITAAALTNNYLPMFGIAFAAVI